MLCSQPTSTVVSRPLANRSENDVVENDVE